MGHADLFAKQTFADETERLTRGAISWQDPPETGLVKLHKVQGDGLLQVRRPDLLADMVAPWSHARTHAQVLIEMKMEGDHLDVPSVQRAVLRRQALWVQRVEERDPPWPLEEPLWLTAPHVPAWLRRARKLVPVGPGCYAVEPTWSRFSGSRPTSSRSATSWSRSWSRAPGKRWKSLSGGQRPAGPWNG